jgi:serine/threonine protein kinase
VVLTIGELKVAIEAIKVIVGVVRQINNAVKTAKANKQQCDRLLKRIEGIEQGLKGLPESKQLEIPSRSLQNLTVQLTDCLEFINQFQSQNMFKKVLKSGNCKEKFSELNQSLVNAAIDLNLGLNILQLQKLEQENVSEESNCKSGEEMTLLLQKWREQDLLDQKGDRDAIDRMRNQLIQNQEVMLQEVVQLKDDSEERDRLLHDLLQSIKENFNEVMQRYDAKSDDADEVRLATHWVIPLDDLRYEKKIYSQDNDVTLYEGVWRNAPVIIKSVGRVLDKQDRNRLVEEMDHLQKVRHPNVIQFYGGFISPQRTYLVLERLSGDTLADVSIVESLTLNQKHEIAKDIAGGLLYLHRQGICHRQLLSSNISLSETKRAKITNFSYARNAGTVRQIDTLCTIAKNRVSIFGEQQSRLAPELYTAGNDYTEAADVFQYGCVIWNLWTGQELPAEFDFEQMEWTDNANIPPDYFTLIRDCCCPNPLLRLTMSEVLRQLQTMSLLKSVSTTMSSQQDLKSEEGQMVAGQPHRFFSPRNDSASVNKGEIQYEEGCEAQKQKNFKKAFTCFTQAIKNGFINAHTDVAILYLRGLGTAQNKRKAGEHLKIAAEAGHPRAQYNYARMHETGDLGEVDLATALSWYQKAADSIRSIPKAREKVAKLSKQLSEQSFRPNLANAR